MSENINNTEKESKEMSLLRHLLNHFQFQINRSRNYEEDIMSFFYTY